MRDKTGISMETGGDAQAAEQQVRKGHPRGGLTCRLEKQYVMPVPGGLIGPSARIQSTLCNAARDPQRTGEVQLRAVSEAGPPFIHSSSGCKVCRQVLSRYVGTCLSTHLGSALLQGNTKAKRALPFGANLSPSGVGANVMGEEEHPHLPHWLVSDQESNLGGMGCANRRECR